MYNFLCLAVRISRPTGALILSSASPPSAENELPVLLWPLVLVIRLSLPLAASLAGSGLTGAGDTVVLIVAGVIGAPLTVDAASEATGGSFGTTFFLILPLPPLPLERTTTLSFAFFGFGFGGFADNENGIVLQKQVGREGEGGGMHEIGRAHV